MSATKHETAGGLYQVPPEPSRWPAISLAVGVHALLLAFLVIGVSWQNNEPVAVEAEVWDVNTQEAAPLPPPPQQQPEPEPQPETPPPQPAPRVAPPPPVEQPVAPKAPDIALEREKKRKEELKQKQQRLEEERQERERELAEQKAEEKKAKALADKKAREEAEKKAEELAKRDEADKKKKAEKEKADKLAKEKAQKADEARMAKLRAEDLKRIQLAASDTGGSGGSGTAEKSSAPHRDSGYEAAIRAKVKGNTAYAGDLNEPGNPTVTFHVDQLPTGDIMSVKKTRSSGIAAFDDAVERAIKASSPLPKKKDGTVERSLEINFKMKDMQ